MELLASWYASTIEQNLICKSEVTMMNSSTNTNINGHIRAILTIFMILFQAPSGVDPVYFGDNLAGVSWLGDHSEHVAKQSLFNCADLFAVGHNDDRAADQST